MNIQDQPCAVHKKNLKLFIFLLRVRSPKFTALIVFSSSLSPMSINTLKRAIATFLPPPPPVCFHAIISPFQVETLPSLYIDVLSPCSDGAH